MKNIRIVWMAAIAVLVGATFTSCSKMDEEKEPVKRLVKFTTENVSTKTEMTFTYDADGHLKGAESVLYEGSNVTTSVYEFTWGENAIDYTMTRVEATDWVETYSLALENGCAKLLSADHLFGQESPFSYDERGRLANTSRAYYNLALGWVDNKLTSVKNSNFMMGYTQTFEYESITGARGYCPLIPHRVGSGILFIAHPELAGLLTPYAPKKESIKYTLLGSSSTSTYTYEYDEDLYMTRIIETGTNNNAEKPSFIHTMVWEEVK